MRCFFLIPWIIIVIHSFFAVASFAGQQETSGQVYRLEQIVELTKQKNFQIRGQAEKLHQAQKAIKVAKGQMIPKLNLAVSVAGAVYDFSTLASSMVGFAFPTNWYRLKGTKSAYQAERFSYLAMVANQINGVVAIYYQAQLFKHNIAITEFYIKKVGEILARVEQSSERAKDWLCQRARLANFRILLLQDRETLKKTLAEFYNSLILVSGLENMTQKNLKIENLAYFELGEVEPVKFKSCLNRAQENSLELHQFVHMIKAARKESHGRKFEFLNPTGSLDAALGYGYKSYIKIGKSQLRALIIQQEEALINLQNSCQLAVNNFNSSLESFKLAVEGLKFSEQEIAYIYQQFQETGKFDAGDFIGAFTTELTLLTSKALALHNYTLAQAQLERLTLSAPFYNDIWSLIPADPPCKCFCF